MPAHLLRCTRSVALTVVRTAVLRDRWLIVPENSALMDASVLMATSQTDMNVSRGSSAAAEDLRITPTTQLVLCLNLDVNSGM